MCVPSLTTIIDQEEQLISTSTFSESTSFLQTELDQGVPFADTKRQEIHVLMKPSISGGYYIPRTDLERITSSDTIRMIIMDDKSVDLSLKEKEAFVEQVCSKGAKATSNMCTCVSQDGVSQATSR